MPPETITLDVSNSKRIGMDNEQVAEKERERGQEQGERQAEEAEDGPTTRDREQS